MKKFFGFFFVLLMHFNLNALNANDEMTLSLIKPDAVKANHIGDIISRFENAGLKVAGIKMVHLNEKEAKKFYEVHKDRPFYGELASFMSSGPIVAIVLVGPNAIAKNREIMGATDPKKAEKGTLRADFATSVQNNAVHGSDSQQSANNEIPFFFKETEILR